MTPLLPKNQISSNKRLRHISPGGLQSSRMCPAGWGISALCIKPIHQLLAEKKRPRALLTPSKLRGGEEISPCELLSRPAQLLEDGFEREARGGEGSPELQGLSMVGKHRGRIQPPGWSLPVPWAPLPSKVSPGLGRVVKSFHASWRRKANAASNPEPWGAWHRLHPLNKVPAEKDHVCPPPVGLPCPATHILG